VTGVQNVCSSDLVGSGEWGVGSSKGFTQDKLSK